MIRPTQAHVVAIVCASFCSFSSPEVLVVLFRSRMIGACPVTMVYVSDGEEFVREQQP